jgi:hypothetical protein
VASSLISDRVHRQFVLSTFGIDRFADSHANGFGVRMSVAARR